MPQDTANSPSKAPPVDRIVSWRSVVLTLLLSFVLLGLPFAVNGFNLVHVTGFPLGFLTIAQVIPVLLAAVAMTAVRHAFNPSWATGSGLPVSRSGGLAMLGVILSPALAIVLFHGVYERGHDGLLPAYAVLAGVALWLMARNWLVPAPGSPPVNSGETGTAGPVSITPAIRFLSALCLVPLAAGHLIWFEQALSVSGGELWGLASLAASPSPGRSPWLAEFGSGPWPSPAAAAAALAAAIIAIVVPARLLIAVSVGMALALVGGSIALAWSLQPAALATPLAFADGQAISMNQSSPASAPSLAVPPQLAYGQALAWIGLAEQSAVASGLADPVVVKIFAKPFSHFNSLNASLSLITYALGAAALSVIAAGFVFASHAGRRAAANPAPHQAGTMGLTREEIRRKAKGKTRGWTGTHWAVFALVIALVTFPAAGAYFKLMQYRTAGAAKSDPPAWLQTASSYRLATLCQSSGGPSAEATDQAADSQAETDNAGVAEEIEDPFAWPLDAGEAEPIDLNTAVAGVFDTRPHCTGPGQRLAVNDMAFEPGMLPLTGVLAAWHTHSQEALSHVAKLVAAFHAALMFFGLVLVIRCVSAGPDGGRHGIGPSPSARAPVALSLAALSVGLVGLLNADWIERSASELPMLSLALLGAAIAPALLLNSLSRRPTRAAVAIGAIGFLTLMLYDVFALAAPLPLLTALEPLSNAPLWRWQEFSAIAQACVSGPAAALPETSGATSGAVTGPSGERVCTAARLLAGRITNIAGLSTASMAAPVALGVFVLGTLFAAMARLVRGRG